MQLLQHFLRRQTRRQPTLLEKANKETAEKAKAALEAAGAKVTLK